MVTLRRDELWAELYVPTECGRAVSWGIKLLQQRALPPRLEGPVRPLRD
jgi:hypothetical protein